MDAANHKPAGPTYGANESPPQVAGSDKTTRALASEGGATTDRKQKSEKPNLVDFLAGLRQSASCEPAKHRFPALMKALKSGYKGRVASQDVESIFSILKESADCSRIALRFCVMSRGKRPPELIRSLRGRLLSHARFVVGYPEKSDNDQDLWRHTLLLWLEHAGKAAKEKQPLDAARARWLLTLLMEEPLLVRTDGIYAVLEHFVLKTAKRKTCEPDDSFLAEIEKLVAAEKLNVHRLGAGLTLAEGARSCGARLRDELLAAESALRAERICVAEFKQTVMTLEQRLALAGEQVVTLEESLKEKTQALEKEQKERGLDGEHWQMQSEQRLTRMAQDISARLSHEVREAKLCLMGDSPNLQMALDRLAQMEEALAKLRAR